MTIELSKVIHFTHCVPFKTYPVLHEVHFVESFDAEHVRHDEWQVNLTQAIAAFYPRILPDASQDSTAVPFAPLTLLDQAQDGLQP